VNCLATGEHRATYGTHPRATDTCPVAWGRTGLTSQADWVQMTLRLKSCGPGPRARDQCGEGGLQRGG
jgi:hypothetical protein